MWFTGNFGVLNLTSWDLYAVTLEYKDIIQKSINPIEAILEYFSAQFFAACPA